LFFISIYLAIYLLSSGQPLLVFSRHICQFVSSLYKKIHGNVEENYFVALKISRKITVLMEAVLEG